MHVFQVSFFFLLILKGWPVKFWVCVAEGIKHLCSLQVASANSPLGNKVTSPKGYDRRSHRGQLRSDCTPGQLSQLGLVVFTKFPLLRNMSPFDVRVF